MVVLSFNPANQKAEAGGSLRVLSQHDLQIELHPGLCRETLPRKTKKKTVCVLDPLPSKLLA